MEEIFREMMKKKFASLRFCSFCIVIREKENKQVPHSED